MGLIKLYAVDFDGTLHTGKYPIIGEPNQDLIDYLTRARENCEKVILWTCREGQLLTEAVNWCKVRGLEFDAVNDNLPENQILWGNNPRKIWADVYIDDKNAMPSDFRLSKRGRRKGRGGTH